MFTLHSNNSNTKFFKLFAFDLSISLFFKYYEFAVHHTQESKSHYVWWIILHITKVSQGSLLFIVLEAIKINKKIFCTKAHQVIWTCILFARTGSCDYAYFKKCLRSCALKLSTMPTWKKSLRKRKWGKWYWQTIRICCPFLIRKCLF